MEVLQRIKSNLRLLEGLAIPELGVGGQGIDGSPEGCFLAVLRLLQEGDLTAAKAEYSQLASLLKVAPDDARMEPLRTLLHLQMWEGDEEDRAQLQQFLKKELGLRFDLDRPQAAPAAPQPSAAAATTAPVAPPLPCQITSEQYSPAAFRQHILDLSLQSFAPGGLLMKGQQLIAYSDPSSLLEAVKDASLPLEQRLQLLHDECVPAALVPLPVLVELMGSAFASQGWAPMEPTDWLRSHWQQLTREQAVVLRALLPGPLLGEQPEVDRPFIAALVAKALAGPADAGDAAAEAAGEAPPWAPGAADAAAAAALGRILAECDDLGPAADWVRVQVLYSQLQLQRKQQPAVDLQLLISFMQLLARCTWSEARTTVASGLSQQQQQPMHIACSVCHCRPIVGPRLRSKQQCGFNVCMRCAGSEAARAAEPLEEVPHDDSIYMLPEMFLPRVVAKLPGSEAARLAAMREMLLDVVFHDGAGGGPEVFTAAGSCPLAAAGLLLPQEWRDSVVAEGKLLAGAADVAAWAQLYQKHHGNLGAIRARTELAFAPHNRSSYSVADEVELQLTTKNVGPQGLLVKVYEMHAWSYYTSEGSEVDLNLELSGVAPSRSFTLATPDNPMIRTQHCLLLGLAGRAGSWLVEVVSGGQRVRARLTKGCLRLLQRTSVAGQVLTVLDEQWRPVEGVRVWCDGKTYTSADAPASSGSGGSSAAAAARPANQVLLPYARDLKDTPLVVAATLPGGSEPTAEECIMLFPWFRRLPEAEGYELHSQLFCPPEALLPGETIPLLLLLKLTLFCQSAPLQLLQDVCLKVSATMADGTQVAQVFKDLRPDPVTGELLLHYTVPQHAVAIAASLTARLLRLLPGVNGEPDWQQFDNRNLFQGQGGGCRSLPICAAGRSSCIWDIYLTATISSSGSSSAGSSSSSTDAADPQYVLQVRGRAGELPAVPKTLSICLSHVQFRSSCELQLRAQTGPDGCIRLGSLKGIRQLRAQIESGADCVTEPEGPQAAVPAGPGPRGVACGGGSGGPAARESSAGPIRSWLIARASWWLGPLSNEYVLPVGGRLDLPLRPAVGQAPLEAVLLQLATSSLGGFDPDAAADTDVVADVSAGHLQLLPASASQGSSGSGCMLGCGDEVVVRIHGLAAGLYRLHIPQTALCSDCGPLEFCRSDNEGTGAVHISVLPPAAAAGAQQAEPTAATAGSRAEDKATGEGSSSDGIKPLLWSAAESETLLLSPSPSQQLHIVSCSCSVEDGLTAQLAGTPQQLAAAQVVAAFSRFLCDDTTLAAAELPEWAGSSSFEPAPTCEQLTRCAYSKAAKLDSAVSYVLQRRQREAAAGGRKRPGSLLERPSLLALPRCVGVAASAASVLKGGDGGRLTAAAPMQMMKRTAVGSGMRCAGIPEPMAAAPMFGAPMPAAAAAAAFAADPSTACQQQADWWLKECCGGMTELGGEMRVPFSFSSGWQPAPPAPWDNTCGGSGAAGVAQTPVLSFLRFPAAVLTGLQPDAGSGLVRLTTCQLQQALEQAVQPTAASADGTDGGSGILERAGYRVVSLHAFIPRQAAPGFAREPPAAQFSSCTCTIAPAGSGSSSFTGGLRDLGLLREVEEDVVCAVDCDVLGLPPGGSLTLPGADAAEAAEFRSVQQTYLLLAGLLDIAESGKPGSLAGGDVCSGADYAAARALLPRPCVPPFSKGASASALLRQWEPLLLAWPGLTASARLELVDSLGSAEMSFFLACRDPTAFKQLMLPILQAKLPSDTCCLEQILLLQASHELPAVPLPAAFGGPDSQPAAYKQARQALLQHWGAPHRYQQLTVLERVLLAALEGREAVARLGQDMRQRLETLPEKRGVKRSWTATGRRCVFDFALLLSQQLAQQQRDAAEATPAQAAATADGDDEPAGGGGGGGGEEEEGFVMVQAAGAVPSPGAAAAFGAPSAAMGGYEQLAFRQQDLQRQQQGAAAMDYGIKLHCWVAGQDEQDLAARSQLAAATAATSARAAPQETRKWAEASWWKGDGLPAAPGTHVIPESMFWANFAAHLGSAEPEQPFIPTDPTGAAASTACITAALAVIGLPWEGTAAASSSGDGSSSGGLGCSRSYAGSTMTLTARAACLLFVKRVRPVASIAGVAGSSTAAAEGGAGVAGSSSSSHSCSNTVMVMQRLYDPRAAVATDPDSGEQVLLSLSPSEQQPLVAGQRYCSSVIVTSVSASVQVLDVLVQLPQGALPLSGGLSTVSTSFKLEPYATHTLSLAFYFPAAGEFKQAPVSVTRRGRPAWLPAGVAPPLHVAPKPLPPSALPPGPQPVQDFNWAAFLASASSAEVLSYLSHGDLSLATLADLACSRFCGDRAFCAAAVAALRARHVFSPAIWAWAVAHLDEAALRELLPASVIGKRVTAWKLPVRLALLDMSFASDVGLQQLEFAPLVNRYIMPIARTDGGDSSLPSILTDNASIANQWRRFLLALLFDFSGSRRSTTAATATAGAGSTDGALGLQQAAAAACYLLLQERLDDAELVVQESGVAQLAERLAPDAPLKMHVDYLLAWLALVRRLPAASGPAVAADMAARLQLVQAVVQRYNTGSASSPAWRKRFAQLAAVAQELQQQAAALSGARLQPAAAAGAAGEPAPAAAADLATAAAAAAVAADGATASAVLSVVSCEQGMMTLQCRGFSILTLSAFQIDTELLFTAQPFSDLGNSSNDSSSSTGLGRVSFVKANATVEIQLQGAAGGHGASQPGVRVEPAAAADAVGVSGAGPAGAGGGGMLSCVLELDTLMPGLAAQSVLLQVAGGGVTRTVPRFASRLVVHVVEAQGILQAWYSNSTSSSSMPGSAGGSSSGSAAGPLGGRLVPAAAAYVKVFARDSAGGEHFYKDGHTDLCGKFDFTTLTSVVDARRPPTSHVTRFSLLVATPDGGAVMLQADPPAR